MFQKVAITRVTLYFHYLQAGSNHFLFLEWVLKKVLWRNYKDHLKRSCRSWKGSKRDWKNNRNLQTFFLCNLGLQKKVHLSFSSLFFFSKIFSNIQVWENFRSNKNNWKRLWGKIEEIILKSLEDKHVLVSKSVPFLFQIPRLTNRRMICNKTTIAITSRGAHLGIDSTKSSYSQ
jgi:hypothetical protein